jgi:glucose-6-phosphate dehydrogenase assembly protein OpcA
VAGEAGDTSRALLAGWLTSRLGLEVTVEDSAGPGITEVEISLSDTVLRLVRGEGQTVLLSHTGQPDRTLPLPSRELGDLLAEELQRLDADETYAEALAAATGRLNVREEKRTHVWVDPMLASDESALVEGVPRTQEVR